MSNWSTPWISDPGIDRAPGRAMVRTYWPSGQLKTRTAAKLRPRAAATPPGSVQIDTSRSYRYDYDPNGNLTRLTDPQFTDPAMGAREDPQLRFNYEYDVANRMVRANDVVLGESDQRGRDTTMAYDLNDNLTRRRTDGVMSAGAPGGFANGKSSSFAYTPLDEPSSTMVDPVGSPVRAWSSTWYPSGQLATRTNPAGRTDTRYWGDDGRLVRHARRRSGASSDDKDQVYGYDRNGNRSVDERASAYDYNSRSQLVGWTRRDGSQVAWRLNDNGDPEAKTDRGVTTTYQYAGGRLDRTQTGARSTAYAYTAQGDVQSITTADGVTAPSVVSFGYDEFDRQTSATAGGQSAGYTYDALDRRLTRTQGSTTTRYRYVADSRLLSEESAAGGGEVGSYDYGPGGERLDQAVRPWTADGQTPAPTGRLLSYGTDADGSVEELQRSGDTAAPAPGMRYAYDPYGAPDGQAALDATAQANPFRFEGHYTDGPTGAIDAQARTYLPDPGLFASPDRLEDAGADQALFGRPGTQSRYALAAGSPVGNPDWDGHDPLTDGGNTTTGHGGPGTMSRAANREARRTTAAARTETAQRIRSNASPDRATPPVPNQYTPNARTRPAPTPAAAPAPDQDDSNFFEQQAGRVADAGASAGRFAGRTGERALGVAEQTAEQAYRVANSPEVQIASIGLALLGPEAAPAAAPGATRVALLVRSLFAGRTATTAASDAAPIANEASAAVNAIRSGIAKSGATKAGDEALRTVTALTREQDAALSAATRDPSKLRHIFGKPEHNLGPITQELGGQEALLREAVLAVPRGTAGKFEVTKQIGRYDLTVRGRVVNGVPRIGTVFVP